MTDLITVENKIIEQDNMMPLMDLEAATRRYSQVAEFVQGIMKEGKDFGIIPGTDKPTLFKPGAEKLTTFFGLTKRFTIIEKVEDWIGQDHGGEPFFYYLYRCGLYRGDLLIAEADGSCNSFESKYRYRKAERICPACGKAAIIKGKADYGGGWLCWKRKDGCGQKFADGDKSIETQEAGRVPNPDICDQVNTFQKMSQKRALVAATLLAVNASDFFTQDIEDYIVPNDIDVVAPDKNIPSNKDLGYPETKTPQSTGEVIEQIQIQAVKAKEPSDPWPSKTGPVFEFCHQVRSRTEYYDNQYRLSNAVGGFGDLSDNENWNAKLSIALDHAKEKEAAANG